MSPANQSNGAEVVGSLQLPDSHSLLLGIGVSGWRERRLHGNKLKQAQICAEGCEEEYFTHIFRI